VARARQEATTRGATSANSPPGRPTDRTARSLRISVSIESRLTLPGTDLISASTESSPVSSSGTSIAISARSRAVVSAGIRPTMRPISACSAWRNAERTIRSIRPGAGGSIRSARQRTSSSSRTSSGRRSASHAFAASHSVSLSASATEHSRKPKCPRICARWYSIVRPAHS